MVIELLMKKFDRSKKLYKKALAVIPGGVNSPVRAFSAVGGNPLFIKSARGSKIHDVDGNSYIDYVLSWGPMILGHAHPRIVRALRKAIEKGTSYGAPTALETELAELLIRAYPSMDKVRLVNSGTEATMSAIRLARGFTGRDKIIKFEGCYHGHADGLLVKAGSGAATFGVPDSAGVPAAYAKDTITLPYNDVPTLKATIEREWRSIAAVIVEPVAGNMGCVLPKKSFLSTLRKITKKYGVLLIFDEVMTGFRVSFGGAQAYYGINPDITCLGKVIGGGLPVGAYGGKNEVMSVVSPEGPVYQAGTLSGNPLAMTAGIETIKELSKPNTYKKIGEKSSMLKDGLVDAAKRAGLATKFYMAGSMFCTYFTSRHVIDYRTAKTSDTEKFSRFFSGMLQRGINLAPSQFESGFMSLAHTSKDIEDTIKSSYDVFKSL